MRVYQVLILYEFSKKWFLISDFRNNNTEIVTRQIDLISCWSISYRIANIDDSPHENIQSHELEMVSSGHSRVLVRLITSCFRYMSVQWLNKIFHCERF